MKPSTLVLQPTRILDQLRERIRHMHYSFSTQQAYVWRRSFADLLEVVFLRRPRTRGRGGAGAAGCRRLAALGSDERVGGSPQGGARAHLLV